MAASSRVPPGAWGLAYWPRGGDLLAGTGQSVIGLTGEQGPWAEAQYTALRWERQRR